MMHGQKNIKLNEYFLALWQMLVKQILLTGIYCQPTSE